MGRCLFCGGELDEAVSKGVRDRLGISEKLWTFRRCRRCGSAILDPMPPLQELLSAYPPIYHVDQAPQTHWLHRLQYLAENRLFYEPRYRFRVRQVQRVTGLKGGKMLDVGGSSGHSSLFFQRAGFDVTVLDPDERALRIAREKFGLRTICGLLEEGQLPDGAFDLVTFWYVVEHLPEPSKTLKAAHKVLRDGGWLVALVPLSDSWQAKIFGSRWAEAREAPRHTSLPTKEGMKRLLAHCGFALRAWKSYSLWNNAGIFALSIVPTATTPAACTHSSLFARLGWRSLGALLVFAGLPFAWLERLCGSPSAGIFFAQKEEKR